MYSLSEWYVNVRVVTIKEEFIAMLRYLPLYCNLSDKHVQVYMNINNSTMVGLMVFSMEYQYLFTIYTEQQKERYIKFSLKLRMFYLNIVKECIVI